MDWNHHTREVNGTELQYLREGSGHPLLLVHGWPEYSRVWRKNIPTLAESFDVIVPDLAGFGASENPAVAQSVGYGVDEHVADLLALTAALDLEEFGFVSHDLGAYLGQRIARDKPAVLNGLFFFDCPYPGIGRRWRTPGHISEIWYQTFNQQPWAAELVGATRATTRLFIEHFLSHWAGDPDAFDEADREAWVETFSKPGKLQGGFHWYVAAEPARKELMRDGAPSLPPIEVPTRILWGEEDPIVKTEWADRLDEYFSDYEFETAAGAGHFVHYEQPDRANTAITAFFENLGLT